MAVVSLIVGLLFMNNSGVLSQIVNCGALTAFLVIHVAVVNHYLIRQHSKDYWRHLIVPVIGFIIIGFVMINLDILAKEIGLAWLIIGAVYYFVLRKFQKDTNIQDL